MESGEMVPITIIVSLLVKTIFAKKSKKYLIDGFPRTLEQVIYFEKNIQECSCILYYDVSESTLMSRMMNRANTNKEYRRSDDKEDIMKKRIKEFEKHTLPVIEWYEKCGKLRKINGEQGIKQVFNETKKYLAPELVLVMGPSKSGKSIFAENYGKM